LVPVIGAAPVAVVIGIYMIFQGQKAGGGIMLVVALIVGSIDNVLRSFFMSKKPRQNPESQVLELLKDVLPKAVADQKLVAKIYDACQKQINDKVRGESFEKFCAKAELPDLKAESVKEIQRQFEESFGKGNVSVIPHPKKEAASVEVVVEGGVLEGVLKVGPVATEEEEDPEFKPKFIPFPVSLQTDPELVWMLGRTENLTPKDAAIALAKVQEDFWASKQGQKLIRERVERSFPEFIGRVPSKLLVEVGLKRHYKDPETLKQLRANAL
ncbi:MAG: hypothetical protein H7Y43_08075, partial [Akkermansiaceae bacterium]|nr:hypothetical protein [Verrucomicrobiales bacterium]